nr:MAG TPA: hypothetical protein [Bacteriophage sp.]
MNIRLFLLQYYFYLKEYLCFLSLNLLIRLYS